MRIIRVAASLMVFLSVSSSAMTVKMNDLNEDVMKGWELHFTDSSYRNLAVHFDDTKAHPQWSTIVDDAAKRYGLAYLLDLENEKVIVTRANSGFLDAGIHYVQPRIVEQQKRYKWNDLIAKAATEKAEYNYQVKLDKQLQREAFEHQNKVQVEQRAAYTRQHYKKKLEKELAVRDDLVKTEMSKLRNAHAQKVATLNKQRTDLEQEYEVKSDALKETYAVKEQRMRDHFDAQTKKLTAEKEQLALEREQVLTAKTKYETLLHNTERNATAQRIQEQYFPDTDRFVSNGRAEPALREFFLRYWDYKLVWSNELVIEDSLKNLHIANPIRFADGAEEVDLRKDVSVIACTLTRDTPHLSFYSELDPANRVVFMQLHQTSEEMRKQIISQCY